MKTSRQNRQRPAPAWIVSVTAISLLCALFVISAFRTQRQRVTASVEIADPVIEAEASAARQRKTPASPVLPDGEVERTALRVREVAALVTGLTLLTIQEELSHQPIATVAQLTERLRARQLLPPGLERQPVSGVLASEHAVLYLRFRPQPLALEVVSLGRTPRDGPALIGRIVTGETAETAATLFLAQPPITDSLPRPFAPQAEMLAQRWQAEPLRDRVISPAELAQFNARLRASAGP